MAYTKEQVEAACKHYAPNYEWQYRDTASGFHLPEFIQKAIVAAWYRGETNTGHCNALRAAWRDLQSTGMFAFGVN